MDYSEPTPTTAPGADTDPEEAPGPVVPWFLGARFVRPAAGVLMVVLIAAHVGGYVAFGHWRGFGHGPRTVAMSALQPLAMLGMVVHATARHFGSTGVLPRWQAETHKSVLSWEVVMVAMCWVLLWSRPGVSSDTAFVLMATGLTAGFLAVASVLVLVRDRRRRLEQDTV